MLQFKQARLRMFHPVRPSAVQMLRVFEHAGDHKSQTDPMQSFLNSRANMAEQLLFLTIVETAKMLVREGRPRDSRWLLDYARQRRPDIFGEEPTFILRGKSFPSDIQRPRLSPGPRLGKKLRDDCKYELANRVIISTAHLSFCNLAQQLLERERLMEQVWLAQTQMDH
jgi:hypothetical protein